MTLAAVMTATPIPAASIEPTLPGVGGATNVPFGSPLPPTATPIPVVVSATPMPVGSSVPPSMTPLPTLSAQEAVSITATALAGFLEPTEFGDAGGVGGASTPVPMIVATSVALMSPEPSSIAALPTATATMTPLPTMTLNLSATPLPAMTMRPTATPVPASVLPDIIPLSAGEIDDNATWDNYLLYRRNFLAAYPQAVHDVDVTERQIITVTDGEGYPVLGARVSVYDGQTLLSQSRTYATGQTLFFPNAQAASRQTQAFHVVIEKDNASADFMLDRQNGPNWHITLANVAEPQSTQLDVLFLLDSTGSMADEIAQLQNNILWISAQIDALPGNIDARYGLVIYRDRDDQYITRRYDFVSDVTAFQSNLNLVRAGGGGDTPESLNEALHDAVQNMTWRGDDTVKLVFLVADAPPHLDYPDDYDYAQEMVIAAQNGIKIHPVASSGLDQAGEFIFRQIGQYTMGHFIFLTYEQGVAGAPGESRSDLDVGEPGDPETQTQGDYTVEQLDELVLRLIQDELAALRQRAQAKSGTAMTLQTGSPDQTVMTSGLLSDFDPQSLSGINLPFIITVVGLSILLGYLLWSHGPAEKPKREDGNQHIVPIEIHNQADDQEWPH